MQRFQYFDMVLISDSDEPEEAIVAGMARSEFDGVMLALVPDGEAGEQGWYDTPETKDGRPTKPVLLFHRGFADPKGDGIQYLSEALEIPQGEVEVVEAWDSSRERPHPATDNRRTLEVHMTYPPYPWFDAAVIGMQMGNRFDETALVEWTEFTDTKPATYTFEFRY